MKDRCIHFDSLSYPLDTVVLDASISEREATSAFRLAARLGKYVKGCERVTMCEFDAVDGGWRVVDEKAVKRKGKR